MLWVKLEGLVVEASETSICYLQMVEWKKEL